MINNISEAPHKSSPLLSTKVGLRHLPQREGPGLTVQGRVVCDIDRGGRDGERLGKRSPIQRPESLLLEGTVT